MKFYISIAVLFLFYGCMSHHNIAFSYRNAPFFLKLNSDSTYNYRYPSFETYEYSKGTWGIRGKKAIVLNSDIRSLTVPIRVHSLDRDLQLSYSRIWFYMDNTLKLDEYLCQVFVNDTLYSLKSNKQLISTQLDSEESIDPRNFSDFHFGYIPCDSISGSIINNPVHSIFLRIMPSYNRPSTNVPRYFLQTEIYYPPHDSLGAIKIAVAAFNDTLFNYKIFHNEKILLKKNGICIFNINTNKWIFMPRYH